MTTTSLHIETVLQPETPKSAPITAKPEVVKPAKSTKAKALPIKSVTSTDHKTSEITVPKAAKTKPEAAPKAAKPVKVKPERFAHSMQTSYSGASPTLNKSKSATLIPVSEFGKFPEMVVTARRQSIIDDLRRTYGTKPFKRGNANAIAFKVGGWKGWLKLVEGAGNSENDTYQFQPSAFPKKVSAVPATK
jgi:hypothetical protein